jgi:hypothetical protein
MATSFSCQFCETPWTLKRFAWEGRVRWNKIFNPTQSVTTEGSLFAPDRGFSGGFTHREEQSVAPGEEPGEGIFKYIPSHGIGYFQRRPPRLLRVRRIPGFLVWVLSGQVKDIHFRISVQTGYADSFCTLSANGAAEIPKYSPPQNFWSS